MRLFDILVLPCLSVTASAAEFNVVGKTRSLVTKHPWDDKEGGDESDLSMSMTTLPHTDPVINSEVGNNSANNATVAIHAEGDVFVDKEGGVLDVKTTHDSDARPLNNPHNSNGLDLFLISGQSNAIGHTTLECSMTRDKSYWADLMRLFNQDLNQVKWSQELYQLIDSVHDDESETGPPEVIATLRDGVVKLWQLGLLNGMNKTLSLGKCSFADPRQNGGVDDISGGSQPTIWSANCGSSFGHELMFSTTLENAKNGTRRNFETVKIAHGGSRMFEDWYPNNGRYWDALNSSIWSRTGAGNLWGGFMWHQGEQESFDECDPCSTYLGNLTHLVAQVRSEMFHASEAGAWGCPEEIPAIIAVIGYWPQGDSASRIRHAQQIFCDEDPRAKCVSMYDLSRNYHFDATSFLISGHRMAEAYLDLVKANVTCPPHASRRIRTQAQTEVGTCPPSLATTAAPTAACFPTPTTNFPTYNPTAEEQ